MRLYLVTDHEGYTTTVQSVNRGMQQDSQQWGVGVTRTRIPHAQFPHFWTSHSLASFLYAAYLDVPKPLLWTGDGEAIAYIPPCTVECRRFTAMHTVPMRSFTATQRVHIALRCALFVQVCTPAAAHWERWARDWLSNEDRSWESAQAMAYGQAFLPFALRSAAEAATWATAPEGTEEHARHRRRTAAAVLWTLRHSVFDIFGIFTDAVTAEPEGAYTHG